VHRRRQRHRPLRDRHRPLPHLAHRRTHHQRRTQSQPPTRPLLGLGQNPRRRLRATPGRVRLTAALRSNPHNPGLSPPTSQNTDLSRPAMPDGQPHPRRAHTRHPHRLAPAPTTPQTHRRERGRLILKHHRATKTRQAEAPAGLHSKPLNDRTRRCYRMLRSPCRSTNCRSYRQPPLLPSPGSGLDE
jgi:hypothetical protein